jgi:hypothetical protein
MGQEGKALFPPSIQISIPPQKYMSREKYLDDPIVEEDDIIRSLREDHDIRGASGPSNLLISTHYHLTVKQTVEYGSYLPDGCIESFRTTAKTHHIRLAPVFLPNGKRVSPDELPIRLENAVVEVMFSLKHYYYGPTTGKFKQTKVGNTYTATIDQITILQVNTTIPSPLREPAMKTIQSTPPSRKGKEPVGTKRASSQPPTESSPSSSKKKKLQGAYHLSRCLLKLPLTVAVPKGSTSSSTTISPTEDDHFEDLERSDVLNTLT